MKGDHSLPRHLQIVLCCQLAIACVATIWALRGEWLSVGVGVASLLLSGLPLLDVRSVAMRSMVSVVAALLLAAHILFGMFFRLYELSALYDKFMHVVGCMAIAVIIFAALEAYCARRSLKLPRALQGALVFSATLSAGALWEIFEFSVDQTGLFYAQRGLADTMVDLIADSLGATLAVILFALAKARYALFGSF